MRVRLVTLSEALLAVDVEADAKLGDLRTAICTHHPYKPDTYELFLDTRVLERNYDAQDLKSLGISENSLVTIVKKQARPAVNMCFFNTSFLDDDLVRVLKVIRRIQDNAPEDEPLLIMISYLHASEKKKNEWYQIFNLTKLSGVCKTYLLREGVLVLACNVKRDDACSFRRMECHDLEDLHVPESSVRFGGLICSMEMRMRLEGESFYDMDVIWIPYLSGSTRRYLINDRALGGAIGMLHARRMFAYGELQGDVFDLATAAERYRRAFGACIMVTHVSDVPVRERPTKTLFVWHAHGKVRVIEGALVNKTFIHDGGDQYSRNMDRLFPVHCLRVRPRTHPGTFAKVHRLSSLCVGGETNTCWLDEVKDTAVIRLTEASDSSRGEARSDPTSVVLSASDACSSAENIQQVEPKMLNVTQDTAVDVDSENDNVCMICLDIEPLFVLADCGHCGLCSKCRKRIYIY